MDQDKFSENVFKEMKKERRYRYFKTIVLILLTLPFLYISFWQSASSDKQDSNIQASLYAESIFNEQDPASAAVKEPPIVAVLPIEGIIYGNILGSETAPSKSLLGEVSPGNMVLKVKQTLLALEKEKNLFVLILYINSPGGTVIASDAIHNMIVDWKKRTGVRVVAYFD